MNQDKQTVAEIAKAELTRLWSEVDNLNKRIDYNHGLLHKYCQHVSGHERTRYYEGGPGHLSYTIKTYTCDLCSKLLKYYNSANTKENNA